MHSLRFRIPICLDKSVSYRYNALHSIAARRRSNTCKDHRRPGDLWRATREVVSQIVSHWFSGRVAGTTAAHTRCLRKRIVVSRRLFMHGPPFPPFPLDV